MPEIDVSEDQLAYLEELQTALADEVPYGHVRHRDALQYLIDRHEDDVADDLSALDDAVESTTTGETDDSDADTGTSGNTPAPSIGTDESDDSPADSAALDTEADETAMSPDTTTTETTTDPDPVEPSASGDDRLQAMMSLLDTYDEHWAESDAEEARYEVTLPDGGVEYARTKDDVRSLLFKHYR